MAYAGRRRGGFRFHQRRSRRFTKAADFRPRPVFSFFFFITLFIVTHFLLPNQHLPLLRPFCQSLFLPISPSCHYTIHRVV